MAQVEEEVSAVPVMPNGALDLTWTRLQPCSIRINGVPALIDENGHTRYPAAIVQGTMQRLSLSIGDSREAPLLVIGTPVPAPPPAPQPGVVVGTSISLTDLLKSRYNTWIVNTKSDSSHQRKYPGLQLGIWNLDKDEVAAYLGDKLGTKTMAASEDPRFKGSSSVWGTWWRQSCNRRGWASTLQWIQQQLLTLGSQTLWWVKASVHADYWWLVKGRPLE